MILAVLGVNCAILAFGLVELFTLPLPLVAPIGLVLMVIACFVVELIDIRRA